jgi:uncharacterized protein (TIGR02001 family)
VTATARPPAALRRLSTLSVAFAGFALASAAPAAAQIGASGSVWSQERLRGYSLSSAHPVARLDLSYDDPSGFYAAVSGSLVYSNEYHLKPLGVQENIGYARKLGSGPTIDVGIHNSNYSKYSKYAQSVGYTEAYAGLIGKVLSGRVYISPNYFHANTWRLYGEVEAGVRPMRNLLVSAHAGMLVPLHGDYSSANGAVNGRTEYDWRLGAARELGPMTLHLDVSGGGPGKDWYDGRYHSRTALVAGAAFLF